jgi:hypothetical protein
MVKEVIQNYQSSKFQKKDGAAPITLTWKEARMIRNHSIRACAREILNANRGLDVVKINLIGSPSTGKTTLAKTLGHLIHTIAYEKTKTPYVVKVFSRQELLNMEETLAKLEPVNHVMIFDDVSWLVAGNNKAKLAQVQKTFTEIRHLPGGQDIKVVIIFNFHYNLSIPKHLRQANFFGYTDLGSSELENTQKLVGMKNTKKLTEFRRAVYECGSTYKEATEDKDEQLATFSYKIGKAGKFTYTYRQPFAPALWWNNDSLRHIVFPSREWIQPVCSICSGGATKSVEEKGDVLKFKELADKTYGESKIRNALRVILFQRGINCFAADIQRATKWIAREWDEKVFDYEEIMKLYNLEKYTAKRYNMTGNTMAKEALKEKAKDD